MAAVNSRTLEKGQIERSRETAHRSGHRKVEDSELRKWRWSAERDPSSRIFPLWFRKETRYIFYTNPLFDDENNVSLRPIIREIPTHPLHRLRTAMHMVTWDVFDPCGDGGRLEPPSLS